MTTEHGFDALMHVACVDWGFCGCIKHDRPLHVTDLIPPAGLVTADQFIDWLILADDANPNDPRWNRHKTALRLAFVECMGADTVNAASLRWSDDTPVRDSGAGKKFYGHLPD
jgi:hypothetical protein